MITEIFRTAGFCLIAALCFFYALFGADFAKTHLPLGNLPLTVPIFVGEAALAGLLVIYVLTCKPWKSAFSWWKIFFRVYLIVLLGRVAVDYVHYGELTFRHAALYYYVLFAALAYNFWDKRIANSPWYYVWALTLALMVLSKMLVPYFWLSCCGLVVILLVKKQRWELLAIFLALVFLTGSYMGLFGVIRTHLVGVWAALLFMSTGLLCIWRASVKLKVGLFAAGILVMGFAVFHYSDRNAVHSLFISKKFIDGYHRREQFVQAHRRAYHPQKLRVQLYNDIHAQTNAWSPYDFLIDPDDISNRPVQEHAAVDTQVESDGKYRDMGALYGDQYFRIFIWKDMLEDLTRRKAWLSGVGLGLPQRSPSLEIMNWAPGEWMRDGWISPHNSFLHVIYRMGAWGMACLLLVFGLFIKMTRDFVRRRDWVGVVLLGLVMYWLTAANFLLILELPYYAIPFWALFGLTCRYWHDLVWPTARVVR